MPIAERASKRDLDKFMKDNPPLVSENYNP